MAIVLVLLAIVIALVGPSELRQVATIGAMGLVITAQVIFLWANRGMVAEYTRAQHHYLESDFESARAILEELRNSGKADFRALTLLGNTYRQLGQLSESEMVLLDAVDLAPKHPFPVYGIGRTFMAYGRYPEAAGAIDQALKDGGAEVIWFDAGEAHYRLGNKLKAIELLQSALPRVQDEPHRALMAGYLLYRLDAGQAPGPELVEQGLPYWERQSKVFEATPYGTALAQDIANILAIPANAQIQAPED
jgi:tetratricopeptide (TPR) repeat protein